MVLGCHAEILFVILGGLQYLDVSLAVLVFSVHLWSEEECSVVGK